MRLFQDESLITDPIKTSIAYAQSAITAKWSNTLLAALILMFLFLAGYIPLMNFIASIFYSIVLYSLGYWIVDRVAQSRNVDDFTQRITTEGVNTLLLEKFAPAAGFYIGFMVFSIIMALLTAAIMWLTGGFEAFSVAVHPSGTQMTPQQMQAIYVQIIAANAPALMFVLITSLFFGYLWPIVYGYALFQKNFPDAFNSVFMFFSTRFWSAAFTGKYFVTVSLWMLVLLGAAILLGITFATIFLVPIGILLLIWIVYFNAVLCAATYNFSDRV